METTIEAPCIMTIFGGTGDLAYRKLFPALYNLSCEHSLPNNFAIVAIGRMSMMDTEFRDSVRLSVSRYSRFEIKQEIWNQFVERIHYFQMDITEASSYIKLKDTLDSLGKIYKTNGNILYYMSVSPSFFKTITLNLKKNKMSENNGSWQRVIIEKPFGHNRKTATELNTALTNVFPSDNIFRIDHYLGKEMLQNLLVIRFGNAMFESIWNSRYIENIQITISETLGVENRAEYFDRSGTLKDMFQNHMLQLLALVAMEPPASLDSNSIRSEKIKFLKSLHHMTPEMIISDVVRGQYGGHTNDNGQILSYQSESGISPESTTETFVAMKLVAGNFRWGNMPFYLRSGKRMATRMTSIIIEFKSLPGFLYFKEYKGMQPNILEIRVQPEEKISFSFNAKQPGTTNQIKNVKMNFCQNCALENNTPESYERLIADALRNDLTLFTSWDEIEASWNFIDAISDVWKSTDPVFPNYTPGTWGPEAANTLLQKQNHQWWS
jgi:glucose-6-phosphate 1-dehydrogenase